MHAELLHSSITLSVNGTLLAVADSTTLTQLLAEI